MGADRAVSLAARGSQALFGSMLSKRSFTSVRSLGMGLAKAELFAHEAHPLSFWQRLPEERLARV